MYNVPDLTVSRRRVYEGIYKVNMAMYIQDGFTPDKASRKANIDAVKTTEADYYLYMHAKKTKFFDK